MVWWWFGTVVGPKFVLCLILTFSNPIHWCYFLNLISHGTLGVVWWIFSLSFLQGRASRCPGVVQTPYPSAQSQKRNVLLVSWMIYWMGLLGTGPVDLDQSLCMKWLLIFVIGKSITQLTDHKQKNKTKEWHKIFIKCHETMAKRWTMTTEQCKTATKNDYQEAQNNYK